MKKNILLIIGLLLISYPASSQNGRPFLAIENQIESYLLQKYAKSYWVTVTPFDTLLTVIHDALRDEEFLDPYGTLQHKMFFEAIEFSADDRRIPGAKELFGFSSHGTVLWDSGPLCLSGGMTILGSSDINKDGETDVLVSIRDGEEGKEYLSHLWVFSWNGTRAQIINDVDPQTGQSVLLSGDDWYELFDWEGDGIKEIRAFWGKGYPFFPDTLLNMRPMVTFSYNGSHYGMWPSTIQVPANTELPQNRLSVQGTCRVVQSGSIFEYIYHWSNSASSRQKIRSVFLVDADSGAISTPPDRWLSWLPTQPFSGILWKLTDGQKQVMVRPGDAAVFRLRGNGLPSIVKYYVKGYAPSSMLWEGDLEPSQADVKRDIETNSVGGYTVAPRSAVAPFVPLKFFDTLMSYTNQSWTLGWIKDQPTSNKYLGYFSSAKSSLQQANTGLARSILQQALLEVDADSTSGLTSEAYALIRYNTEYLLSRLPAAPSPGLVAKLINSGGTRLTTGSLQYYDGSWKDATNNNDGTFSVNTTLTSMSLRMTYEGGSQQKNNVPVGPDTVVFQTVDTQVKLQNSQGALIDTGTVQYYSGSWRSFGTTSNGVATKELLPSSYSFRMTYASGSDDKQQDIGTNPVVVFSTTNATVQLKNSQGALIDQGTVQYYAGAWKSFGTTSNGTVSKELLPANYSFRMMYAYGSNDKQQNIGTSPTVIFNTVNATVELRNSQGTLMHGGTVQYYAGAWRSFGTTAGGSVSKELLPANYTFRMAHEYVSVDKAQNISTNSTVGFSTVLCTIRVRNSQGEPVNGAVASYYSGAWRQIGQTANGEITKELLPAHPTFRISYGGATQDKVQNLATNAVVEFVVQ
jgi:hypothetical protein